MPASIGNQPEGVPRDARIPDGHAIVGQPAIREGQYWAGVVVGWQEDGYHIRFVRGAPSGCQPVRVWYQDGHKTLVSCEGRITAVGPPQESLGHLVVTSAPTAALGRRRAPRVSLPEPGATGLIGFGIKGRVVDISAGGIGVVVSELISLGCIVNVVFECAGRTLTGQCRVVNRRRQADGQYRCGLCALESEVEFRKDLLDATVAVQEEQSRRHARKTC